PFQPPRHAVENRHGARRERAPAPFHSSLRCRFPPASAPRVFCATSILADAAMPVTSFASRTAFVTELARRLHENGTSAQRLEAAIEAVARRLGVICQVWANPTGLILAFAEGDADPDSGDMVKIVRLAPGETDLARLAAADAIAERVLAGELGVVEGRAELRALHRPMATGLRVLTVLAFGLAAACVAGLLRAGFTDVVT